MARWLFPRNCVGVRLRLQLANWRFLLRGQHRRALRIDLGCGEQRDLRRSFDCAKTTNDDYEVRGLASGLCTTFVASLVSGHR